MAAKPARKRCNYGYACRKSATMLVSYYRSADVIVAKTEHRVAEPYERRCMCEHHAETTRLLMAPVAGVHVIVGVRS